MIQDLTVFNAKYWAPTMQKVYFKENVARALANEELRDVLVNGTTVEKPYRGGIKDQDYSKGVPISTFNTLSGATESITVDTCRVVPFYIDDIDKLQNKWDMAAIYAKDAQMVLNNRIDQKVLSRYIDAYSFVSAQDLGGSGTGSATISTANVANLFTVAGRNLDKHNRGQMSRFSVVGPRLKEILKLSVSSRETPFGDTIGANGLIGMRYGFDIHYSNNIPFTAVVTSAAIPVAGQFFYVDGVCFNWVASGAATVAGDVSIGANEDAAYANLVLAIIGTATPSAATYRDVSPDDREALHLGGITATYAAHVTDISGFGDVVVSIGTTTNVVLTSNIQYPLFGIKGATDLLVQKEPNVEFRVCENLLGRKVYAWNLYGVKTFTKEKKSLVYAKVDTSSWV